MKPISTHVEIILLQDEVAFEAIKRGLLNLSQYAKQIHQQVAERRMESVSLGSIVTALSRLSDTYKQTPSPVTEVVFDQISLFQGLVETSYAVQLLPDIWLQHILAVQASSEDFFELTVGKNEITCITSASLTAQLHDRAGGVVPLVVLPNLIGITFRFSEDVFHESGILYRILRVFAIEQISIIEFVSTYREATVILSHEYIDDALRLVHHFFRQS